MLPVPIRADKWVSQEERRLSKSQFADRLVRSNQDRRTWDHFPRTSKKPETSRPDTQATGKEEVIMKSFSKSITALIVALMLLISLVPSASVFAADGSITITDNAQTGATVENRTFKGYRLFDATFSENAAGVKTGTYTMTDEQWEVVKRITGVDGLTIDGQSKEEDLNAIREWLSPSDPTKTAPDAEKMQKFAKAVLDANVDAGNKLPTVDFTNGKAENLDHGYYLIQDTTQPSDPEHQTLALVAITNTNPNGTIVLKASKVPGTKKIDNAGGKDNQEKQNLGDTLTYDNHAIGDTVTFTLTSKVPDMTGFDTFYFIFHDKLSKGFTFDADNANITVKVGNKTLTKKDGAAGETYEVESKTEGTDTIINFIFNSFEQYKELKGQDITVTYEVTLNEKAEIGKTGNPNEFQPWFQRDKDEETGGKDRPDDKDIKGKGPTSKTKTYTTELVLRKTDEVGNPLAGAEFTLSGKRLNKVFEQGQVFLKTPVTVPQDGATYTPNANVADFYLLKDGTYTDKQAAPGTEEKYQSTTDTYKLYDYTKVTTTTGDPKSITVTTGGDGFVKFTGLAEGTYKLTETEAPAGYTPAAPIWIKIGCTEPTDQSGEEECTWTWSWAEQEAGPYQTATAQGDLPPEGLIINGVITVKNTKNTLLPSTGGIGTTLFYTLGGLLAVAALVVLVSRKRMTVSEK